MRESSSLPLACSGDMYATVPMAEPGLVRCSSAMRGFDGVAGGSDGRGGLRDLGQSEVEDFGVPRLVTKIFAGLMSRWTMPCAWAASSASAISMPSESSVPVPWDGCRCCASASRRRGIP